MEYISRTDEDLKKIAKDLYNGHIFTDRHVENARMINLIFLPLNFVNLKEKGLETFFQKDLGMIFEYHSKAVSRINDMPVFGSCHLLNKIDTSKVSDLYNQIKLAMDSI